MKDGVLNTLLLALAFILGSLVNSRLGHVYAQTPLLQRLQPGSFASIPREWGDVRGVSDKYLVFEDARGTIRIALIDSGVHNFIQIDRQ